MPIKPEILKVIKPEKSALFRVEQVDLRFSNGEERRFERLASSSRGAVMVLAIDAEQNIVLIREYATGFDDYVLTLPKGVIDPGEDALQAANRELQEEAGFGANHLNIIRDMSAVPNYMGNSLTLVVAQDLYESHLEGDEPEPLEVVKYPLADIETLAMKSEFHEGRAIAALYLVKQWLTEQSLLIR